MKKWLLPSLVVIVVLGAVVYILTQPKSQTPAEDQKATFDPQNPNFILGQVVSVADSSMQVKSGGETYTVAFGTATKLSKQVTIEGVVSQADAVITDFKADATVVVYYEEGTGNENVSAGAIPTKIQIISQ